MVALPISRGVPCPPNGGEEPRPPPPSPRHFAPALAGVFFLAVFVLLQVLWGAARGTAVERLLIDTATVRTAVGMVNLLTPELHATAVGSRIKAPGGGINILNGCEGIEALFLLAAAFSAFPLPWRSRLAGLAAGTVFVFVLNQARILALFYAFRSDKALFDLLHGTVAPIILIALTSLFFLAWSGGWRRDGRTATHARPNT